MAEQAGWERTGSMLPKEPQHQEFSAHLESPWSLVLNKDTLSRPGNVYPAQNAAAVLAREEVGDCSLWHLLLLYGFTSVVLGLSFLLFAFHFLF